MCMAKQKKGTSGPYHHGDLRTALIGAATTIVEREGVMALSLRGVAREAGVSQTAPYHHFPDKQALLAAVAETGFRDLAFGMTETSEKVLESGDLLVALGQAYVAFATANPGRFRLMFGPLVGDKINYPDLLETSAKSLTMISDAVAKRRADLGATGGTLEADTMAAWATVHGLATLLIDSGFNTDNMGAKDQPALVSRVTRSLVNGLGRG